jgi:hypothetical protein
MSVVLDVTQSGSGSTEIHVQAGDILGPITGITFAFNNTGTAS